MNKDWEVDKKYICVRCGELDYTDYYCGGCHSKCCDEIAGDFMDMIVENYQRKSDNAPQCPTCGEQLEKKDGVLVCWRCYNQD